MDQKISTLKSELADIKAQLEDTAIFSTPKYPKLAKRQSKLENTIGLYDKLQSLRNQLIGAQTLLTSGGELAELAIAEVAELQEQII